LSDNAPIVDCHECKDLAFARNLTRQMKEGYGRHNSNLAFRPGNVVLPIIHIRENQQARVIGRIGDRALRERWQDCEIGDAVPASRVDWPAGTGYRTVLMLPRGTAYAWTEAVEASVETLSVYERRTFERVSCRTTGDGARTWIETHFWKRLS